MLINELSKRSGLSIHTIRYYENRGLIQGLADEQVKTNNYKNYDEGCLERLEIITEAKEVGFTLAEIKKFLESWYSDASNRAEQIAMFGAKIKEIDEKIVQLQKVKKRLETVVIELGTNTCES